MPNYGPNSFTEIRIVLLYTKQRTEQTANVPGTPASNPTVPPNNPQLRADRYSYSLLVGTRTVRGEDVRYEPRTGFSSQLWTFRRLGESADQRSTT
eukprot:scaffold674410_cov81-Prasinocladus_malaysianus.AAC.1